MYIDMYYEEYLKNPTPKGPKGTGWPIFPHVPRRRAIPAFSSLTDPCGAGLAEAPARHTFIRTKRTSMGMSCGVSVSSQGLSGGSCWGPTRKDFLKQDLEIPCTTPFVRSTSSSSPQIRLEKGDGLRRKWVVLKLTISCEETQSVDAH